MAELSKREAVPEKELGLELRLLDTEDAELVAEIAAKRGQPLSQYLERARSRLQHEICMVTLVDGEFAGYYWANTHACLDPITRTPLFPLASNEAYLAYLYVAPQYRGSRIAGALSIATRRVLADQGRNRFYYIISQRDSVLPRRRNRLQLRLRRVPPPPWQTSRARLILTQFTIQVEKTR